MKGWSPSRNSSKVLGSVLDGPDGDCLPLFRRLNHISMSPYNAIYIWLQGRSSWDDPVGTHAKNVDFPHPSSPSRSKETGLLPSVWGSASAMLEWLLIRFMRNCPGIGQLALFGRSINKCIAENCLSCECRTVYISTFAACIWFQRMNTLGDQVRCLAFQHSCWFIYILIR